MNDDFETLEANKDQYDAESQAFIDSLRFVKKEIAVIETMKRTAGWKVIEKKTREELQQRIMSLIEKDPEVKILLALLNVADTKSQSEALEAEISKILPNPTG
jgi:hypothetical protein